MKRFLALFLVICMMLVPTISFADSSTVTLESILSANGIDINDFDGYELREVKRKSSNGVNAFSSEGTFAGDALVFKKSQGNLYTETILIIYDTSNNIITPNPRARMMTLKNYGISIVLNTSYYTYQDPCMMHYYRPYSVKGHWTSTDSSEIVTEMTIEYSTSGMAYAYPECKETCFPTQIGSKSYRIARSVSNPTKGVDYSKSYAPSNYALQYAGIDAGSNLAVDVKTNKRSWSDGAAALPYASMNPGE